MEKEKISEEIENGQAVLGIEFGSTRIKAVLINTENIPVASGCYDWENILVDGIWTYSMESVKEGMAVCYLNLKKNVHDKYNVTLRNLRAIGISAMMHGYIAVDKKNRLLTPFRTWRNNITEQASTKLSEVFSCQIPQRWTIAHLYQSIINNESYIPAIDYVSTLSGYVHRLLTGRRVIGIGDASGMFPVNSGIKNYNRSMMKQFDGLIQQKGYPWKLNDIFPEVLVAGQDAGYLTKDGTLLLDPSGDLKDGIPLCPPEGDAGTGMVATDSVEPGTGNISAGTSVFTMIVLERELLKGYKELDIVSTPSGNPVAMAHADNCTGEYDNWIELFGTVIEASGVKIKKSELYDTLLSFALKGEKDCGGLLSYGYISGEHMTGFSEGRPLFVRKPNDHFTIANFMRCQLFTSLCAMRIGVDILFKNETVPVYRITGHGGFFKTPFVGQKIMSAALDKPISVMSTAGEGGAWGIALLASYLVNKKKDSLSDFLKENVFDRNKTVTVQPDFEDVKGFNKFFSRYKQGLQIEHAAVRFLNG